MAQAHRFGAFLARSFTDPRGAFAEARAVGPTHADLWGLIVLTTILRVFGEVLVGGTAITMSFAERDVTVAPMTFGMILFSGTALSVFVLHQVARVLGGKGNLGDMLLAFAIIDVLSVTLYAAQIVVLFTVPGLLPFVQIAAGALMIVALLNMISVAEGFDSVLKALATVILGVLGVAVGAALFIILIGGGALIQT